MRIGFVLSFVAALGFAPLSHAQSASQADKSADEVRLITDMPEREDEFRALIAKAQENTRAFFGELNEEPTYVFCASQQCRALLGMSNVAGFAFGDHGIAISPVGITEMIVTHERVHTALHGMNGIGGMWNPRFPIWFDEGLASHISEDNRLTEPEDPREADWILEADSIWDWRALTEEKGWRASYGAARRLVTEIEDTVGRDGLRALVDRVGAGADFDTEYKALFQN